MGKITVKALIEGGKAKPGPPLGPTLAQHKVNIPKVISAINEKTKEFAGMQVPVNIEIDTETKEFNITVGLPPVSALIKKELNLQKLARAPFGTYKPKEGEKMEEFKGNLKFEEAVKIAKIKIGNLNTNDLKKAVKQIVGTCVSCGVTVEGKHPKEIIKEIDEGKWDDKLKA